MRSDLGAAVGDRVEGRLERGIVAWVRAVRQRPRHVLVAAAAITIAALGYTAASLGIDADHTALLSHDLPFWVEYNEFAQVFPIIDHALLVVVDGETPYRARQAAEELSQRLRERPEAFSDVYVPGGGEFFERHALLYLSAAELENLTDHLASVQPLLAELSRDRSLQGLARILDEGIELAQNDPSMSVNLSSVFDSVSLAAQTVLDGNPRPVSWIEVLLQRSLPGDSSRRLLVVEPILEPRVLFPAREPIRVIREEADALGLVAERGTTVRITGNVALNYEEMLSVSRQAGGAALLSFLVVAFILYRALRSWRLVAAIAITLLVGLVWTGAFAAVSVGHLNVVSVAFGVLFIGLGVDFGIHLGMRYAELHDGSRSVDRALVETTRRVGPSLVLCALTTATGFYVFWPTDYRGVAELGLIAGTGMPISLFCNLTVLPAILVLFGPPEPIRPAGAGPSVTDSLVEFAVGRAVWVRWTALALATGALVSLQWVRFDHNVAAMRDPSTESVETFNELLRDSETSPWTVDVIAPDLPSAERLAEKLLVLPVVERAVTLSDYVPENQEEKLDILADLALFVPQPASEQGPSASVQVTEQIAAVRALRHTLGNPWLTAGDPRRGESARRAERQLDRVMRRLERLESREDVVEGFELSLLGALPEQMRMLWNALDPGPVELSSLPSGLTRRMVASDGRARIEVLPRRDLGVGEELERFVDGVRAEVPLATGSAVTLLEWARVTVSSFQKALTLALLAVVMLVWLIWRRVQDVLLVTIPLVLAVLLTVAGAALLDIAFNFANVVVLPLLLGIGVDSGIHLVHRYRVSAAEALAGAGSADLLATSTARAVFYSALTTMASFGTLAFATHRGIGSLGQLLLIGVTLTLACNLLVLPALIAARRPAQH